MQKHVSYGVIPLKKVNHQWQVFLVQHQAGHWGFPKGFPEENEGEREAAERELMEECGLHVQRWLSDKAIQEHYVHDAYGPKTEKTVHYFLAEVEGILRLQKAEIQDGKWLDLDSAFFLLTFPASKFVMKEVKQLLILI
ncbi:MAG: hypothetical protein CMO81_03785 [Waddliaceae bacterium]|nr:hypothetical protein [Waddliaceae bacterium]